MKLSTFLSESELKSLTKINSEDNQQSSGMPAWYEKEKRNSLSLQAATKEKKKLQDKKMRHAIRNMKEDEVDTVTLDIPLLLRIMEYAREDAQQDVDLHDVAEKMIELSKSHEYLCMDNYDEIIGNVDEESKGLYYYVNKRKKAGTSRSKNHPKAPSPQDWKDAAKTAKKEDFELAEAGKIKGVDGKACWPGKRYAGKEKKSDGTYKDICVPVKKRK